jgi:hypothetical protein
MSRRSLLDAEDAGHLARLALPCRRLHVPVDAVGHVERGVAEVLGEPVDRSAFSIASRAVETVTDDEIRFVNGTGFAAFPCSSRGGRGWPIFALLLDEFAHFLDETEGPQVADRVAGAGSVDGAVRGCGAGDRRVDAVRIAGPVRGRVPAGAFGGVAGGGRAAGCVGGDQPDAVAGVPGGRARRAWRGGVRRGVPRRFRRLWCRLP